MEQTPCNEVMFRSFKNVIFSRFKRTLDKVRVIDYINKYRGRYALNDSQNKEENIIDKTLKYIDMPNNIKNLLIVKSDNKVALNHFLNEIKGECEVIDFNTIIPMPKEYKGIESSTATDRAIKYFLYKNNIMDEVKAMFRPYELDNKDFIRYYDNYDVSFQNECLKLGEKCVELYHKYGAKDWYDWRIKNWETKWNAYEQSIEYLSDTEVEISFETAWCGVPNLIEKLSSKFPSLKFIYKFADEDMGYNCGVGGTLDDGTWIFEHESWQSDNAMDLYIECHKENKDDFYKDELGRWHNRNWEDDDE